MFSRFRNFIFHSHMRGVFFFFWRPQDHPYVWWFARRTHRTHYIVLTAKVYYSERMYDRISKGEKTQAESGEIHAWVSDALCFLWGNTLNVLVSPAMKKCNNCVQCFCLEKPIRTLAPKILTGNWSRRYPLPSNYQNCRLPEGSRCSA